MADFYFLWGGDDSEFFKFALLSSFLFSFGGECLSFFKGYLILKGWNIFNSF